MDKEFSSLFNMLRTCKISRSDRGQYANHLSLNAPIAVSVYRWRSLITWSCMSYYSIRLVTTAPPPPTSHPLINLSHACLNLWTHRPTAVWVQWQYERGKIHGKNEFGTSKSLAYGGHLGWHCTTVIRCKTLIGSRWGWHYICGAM